MEGSLETACKKTHTRLLWKVLDSVWKGHGAQQVSNTSGNWLAGLSAPAVGQRSHRANAEPIKPILCHLVFDSVPVCTQEMPSSEQQAA
jgi:hypothetical protein